jgi:hypothetical protein
MTPSSRGADRARGDAVSCSSESRGRREDRALAAPAVPRAKKVHGGSDHRFGRDSPAFPAQWFERFTPRSPRRRIRLVTVIDGLNGLVRPGWACKTSADLTPATGARTTRLHRTRPVFAKRPRRVWYPSSEALMKTEAAPFVCAPVDRSQLSKKSRPASPLAPDAAASIAFRHRRP